MMKIQEVTAEEYQRLFPSPQHVYNSVRFTELNAPKVRAVRRFCLNDGKPRLGLTVGERADGSLAAPFSAPFAGFDFNRVQSAEVMTEAAQTLRESLAGLRISLPPAPYSPEMNLRTQCALVSAGASVTLEWNHHLDLSPRIAYESLLESKSRNKLRQARRSGFSLLRVNDDPLRAYEVIRINRSERGYPLRMSADDVIMTTGGRNPVVKADFFVLTDGRSDVASAMVYRASEGIAQVIYWGNVEALASECAHPMNLLAERLYEYYSALGLHTLDIGPSSESGIPSTGLCDFKESVGCRLTPKPILTL